jgi:hypothetical protein
MFIITKPNELKNKITSEMVVDKMCEKLMQEINKANSNGNHKCTFYICGVYGNTKTGEFPKEITSEVLHNSDYTYFRFDDYSDMIKKRFIEAGYCIKPTGYIGGVWQLSEDIYW